MEINKISCFLLILTLLSQWVWDWDLSLKIISFKFNRHDRRFSRTSTCCPRCWGLALSARDVLSISSVWGICMQCVSGILFCREKWKLPWFFAFLSKDLPDDWRNTVDEFKHMFDHLYSLQVLTETPKIHILYVHLGEYLEIQSKTDKKSLVLADCQVAIYRDKQRNSGNHLDFHFQGLEACHSGLRKSDRRHNCDVKHHQVFKNYTDLIFRIMRPHFWPLSIYQYRSFFSDGEKDIRYLTGMGSGTALASFFSFIHIR